MPRNLQFNDRLQMDIVYVVAFDGKKHPFLGVVDVGTSYHVAAQLTSRKAHHVANVFLSHWVSPFGVPLEAIADDDLSFKGEFSDTCSALGIDCTLIPPEAHHHLGVAE